MSLQMNFLGSLNAISSPESDSGQSPPAQPVSLTISRSGPDPAHASLSARQAEAMGLLTIATCGRIGFGSSRSNDLSQSWANRLQPKTALLGSTLYALTWKDRITPGGRSIFALRASARPISVSGYSCAGWVTSSATDGERGGRSITDGMTGSSLTQMAPLAGWGTPQARDTKGAHSPERIEAMKALGHGMQDLPDQVAMAGWPTSRREDGESSGARWNRGKFDTLTAVAMHLAGWSTASARDWKDSENMATMRPDGSRDRLDQLPRQAMLVGWQAPTAMDSNRGDYQNDRGNPDLKPLSNTGMAKAATIEGNFAIRCEVRQTVSGLTLTGYSVEILTGQSCGQLDPAHSAWLQGIPVELRNCVHTAMRSISKSRRRSSKPSDPT